MNSTSKDILAQAVELHRWLEADHGTPASQRATRDRAVGLDASATSPRDRVLYWWSQTSTVADNSVGHLIISVRFWLSVALCLLGLLVGGSLSSLALAYEGDYPINVLALLGVLVGLPGLLLLMTLVSAIMRSCGLKPLAAMLNTFNINRWVLGLWDRYSGIQLGASLGQNTASGRLAFWQVALFSQWFGLSFYVGALFMFGVMLAFTDLAFGWSTTLDIQVASIRQWVTMLAWPWAQWWPQAVPDMALIEASRIYRLDLGGGELDATLLRAWWPFVLMTLLVWGLLPRAMALMLAQWRVRQAAVAYLLEHSEVTALLDRMSTPIVSLGDGEEDVQQVKPLLRAEPVPVIPLARPVAIVWNAALTDVHLPGQLSAAIMLSSLQDEQERSELLSAAAGLLAQADGVAVMTKGWEPPLLEFLDLLQQLRQRVGNAKTIVVSPLGLPGADLSATDQAIWQQFVARMEDAHTYVVGGVAGSVEVSD